MKHKISRYYVWVLIKGFGLLVLYFYSSAAAWDKSTGPYGGSIRCLTKNKSTGSFFAGTEYHGIFISSDQGKSWRESNIGLTDKSINAVECHFDQWIFLATNMGVFVSTNGGSSWGQPAPGLKDVCIDVCSFGNYIYACTKTRGLFRSNHQGINWTVLNEGLPSLNITGLSRNATYIFAATAANGVYRNTYSGVEWKPCKTGLTNLSIKYIAADGNKIFASTNNNELFLSENNGDNWRQLALNESSQNILSIAISDTFLVVGTYKNIYVTSTNTILWKCIPGILVRNNTEFNDVLIDGNVIFGATTSFGVISSKISEITWTECNNGLLAQYNASISSYNSSFYCGSIIDGVVYRSSNNCKTWDRIFYDYDKLSIHDVHATETDLAIATSWYFFISKAMPLNWQRISGLKASSMRKIAYDGINYLIATDAGLYKVTSEGEVSLNNIGLDNCNSYDVLVFNDIVFLGTERGLYYSNLSEISWKTSQGIPVDAKVKSLTSINGIVFVGLDSGGVYHSPGNDQNWVKIHKDIGQKIRAMSSNEKFITIATADSGIFISADEGRSWTSINDELSDTNISDIAMNRDLVVIIANSGELYVRPLAEFKKPEKISAISCEITSNNHVKITWNHNLYDRVDKYVIHRRDSLSISRIDSVDGSYTSFTDSTTLPFSYYEYNITGKNNFGESDTSSWSGIKTKDTIHPDIDFTDASSYAVQLYNTARIRAFVADNDTVVSVILKYKKGNDPLFSKSLVMTKTSENSYEALLPENEVTIDGLVCEITAFDRNGNSSIRQQLIPIRFPSNTIKTSTVISGAYKNGFPHNQWRLFSVPFQNSSSQIQEVLKGLGTAGKKSWLVFDENAQDVTRSGKFELGRAFWLKQINRNYSVDIVFSEGVTAGADKYSIILRPGWNIIGNPFTFPLNWKKQTNCLDNLYIKGPIKYDGNRYIGIGQPNSMEVDELLPFDGYFVYNAATTSQILSFFLSARNDSTKDTMGSTNITTEIYLMAKTNSDSACTTIGVADFPQMIKSVFCLPELPAIFPRLRLFIENHQDKHLANSLTTEYKNNEENHCWNIAIFSASDQLVELSWQIIKLPHDQLLAIIDAETDTAINTHEGKILLHLPKNLTRRFKLLIGPLEYLKPQSPDDKIKIYKTNILGSSPNPFNSTTNISFSIANSDWFDFIIYNVLGNKVRTVYYRKHFEPGTYNAIWDGTDQYNKKCPTGPYFGVLQSQNKRCVTKIMLIE